VTDASQRLSRAWRTLDFKTAATGWRVVYLDPEKAVVLQVPGWLVQESYLYDLADDQAHDDDAPERRVIPGVCSGIYDWLVEPIDVDSEFLWRVLAPGEPEPTYEEEQAERAKRAEDRKQRRG